MLHAVLDFVADNYFPILDRDADELDAALLGVAPTDVREIIERRIAAFLLTIMAIGRLSASVVEAPQSKASDARARRPD
jgi:hypothetical protein